MFELGSSVRLDDEAVLDISVSAIAPLRRVFLASETVAIEFSSTFGRFVLRVEQ